MAYRIVQPDFNRPATPRPATRKPAPATTAATATRSASRRNAFVSAAVAVAIAGGGTAYAFLRTPTRVVTLPSQTARQAERERFESATPEQREAMMAERRAQFEAMTPEERQKRGEEMRAMFTAEREHRERERMDAYFAADDAGKQALLDKELDDMQTRMARFANRPQGGPGGRGGDANGVRGQRTPPTQEQRNTMMRNRLANTNPVERAKQDKYRADLRVRAQQRGMTMPGGPGGPGGGPGGGRRG